MKKILFTTVLLLFLSTFINVYIISAQLCSDGGGGDCGEGDPGRERPGRTPEPDCRGADCDRDNTPSPGSSSSSGNGDSSSSNPSGPILYSAPTTTSPATFFQKLQLSAGNYALSANAYTAIIKGGGAYMGLMCDSASCGGGSVQGSYQAVLVFPETTDFETRTVYFTIPTSGAGKNYQVRFVVADGSEAYIYHINLMDSSGTNHLSNPDLNTVKSSPAAISLDQPDNWGDGGDNKVGYYYGRALVASSSSSSSSNSSNSSNSSATGSASVKLNLKLKLQGVTTKPKTADPIKIKVKLGGGSLTTATEYQTVDFNVDSAGVWSGTAGFNVTPGNNYKVYIKGPKHLQKKVCDSTPSETAGGTYRCGDGKINIVAGDNALDFSKILMLVGDLPENNAQNGIVDAYDTSYVRQHLQSSKPDELKIGDLNYDGNIDGQDFSLVLASLSIKYDEE